MDSKLILQELTEQEQNVIKKALELILSGRYIHDYELHPRLGVTREELTLVNECFPWVERAENEEAVSLSIHNTLGEVCYGLKIPVEEWKLWFDVSQDEAKTIFKKWKAGEKRA